MSSAIILSAFMVLNAFPLISAFGNYDAFRHIHGGAALGEGATSYQARRDLFEKRKAEALAHNALNESWAMVVNHFSDHTHEELRAMLGHRPEMGRFDTGSESSSFMEINAHGNAVDTSKLASTVDWRNDLATSASWVRNQGSCGSCWAVAAVGALETAMEREHGHATPLSHQQLVDCVENRMHCGGEGGCKGATAELAYERVRKFGISADSTYKSGSGDKCNTAAPSSLGMAGFVRLPVNKQSHLLKAVAEKGPAVVSVDGGAWFGYGADKNKHFGVFNGCKQDTVVNHAVLAMGYGFDAPTNKKYWLLRNSWGKEWGDKGFIKMERHENDGDYCGVDKDPKAGVFCDDAPASTTVCGMCGVASDSVQPHNVAAWGGQKSLRGTNDHQNVNSFDVL